MNRTVALIITTIAVLTLSFASNAYSEQGQNQQLPNIKWVRGPQKAMLGTTAEIQVPKGFVFCNGEDTRRLMESYGNPPTNIEVGYLSPDSMNWFVIFEFEDIGYVKDDEKDSLNADEMLQSMKESNREANKWRTERGMPELNIVEWYKKPNYNPKTNNLEWSTLLESAGNKVLNYNIRYLGRKGVMRISIVGNPNGFDKCVAKSNDLLNTFHFTQGNRYTEFVQGDKIAEYGLIGLITAGSVAAAAKSGLLTKLWKFIVAGGAAVAVFFRKVFAKLFKRNGQTASKSSKGSSS